MNLTALRSGAALTLDDVRRVAPSVFAEHASPKASAKYQFIPTFEIVTRLQENGMVIVAAAQAKTRLATNRGFTFHQLRFRRASDLALAPRARAVGDVFPEIVLSNSHDLSTAYNVNAGLFRLACMNGMTLPIGRGWGYGTRHTGDVVGEIVDGTFKLIDAFPKLMDTVERWRGVHLTRDQQLAFADAAMPLRFPIGAQVDVEDLVRVRREDDRENDLWTTYNRLQENLLRKGTPVGRRTSRDVTSLVVDTRINKSLWTLAERLEEIVS